MEPPPPAPPTDQPKTSRLAITSLCLGISGFIILLLGAIPAIITGHIAQGRIRRSQGRITGDGIAIAGLVCGYLGLIFSIFAGSIAVIGLLSFKQADQQIKRMEAERTCIAIDQAVLSFYDEYARLPGDGNADRTITTSGPDAAKLLAPLYGENPRELLFIDLQYATDEKGGLRLDSTGQADALFDPWGNPYRIVIDYDYDDTLPNPFGAGRIHGKTVLTFSYGPNGNNDAGKGDDVKSW